MVVVFCSSIHAQFIKDYGFKFGMGLGNVQTNINVYPNEELDLSSAVKWSIRFWASHLEVNKWSFISEIGYLQKGAKDKMVGTYVGSDTEIIHYAELSHYYLTYSFICQYNTDLRYIPLYILVTPQLNLLTGSSRGEAEGLEEFISKVNFGYSLGMGVPFEILSVNMFLEYRFEHDLYSISKSDQHSFWNSSHSILLGFEI